jgi:hypothetical protein
MAIISKRNNDMHHRKKFFLNPEEVFLNNCRGDAVVHSKEASIF